MNRLALIVAAAVTCGCADHAKLAAQLEKASIQPRLPKVVACYERAFEAAGFSGEYDAIVELTIEGGTGNVRESRVTEVVPVTGVAPGAEFESCLATALDGSTFASGGMRPEGDVRVRGMRIAFRDGSAEARKSAAEVTGQVLVGPRADRCLGLYGWEPPRDAATLYAELDDAQAKARRLQKDDPDGYARSLQRAYDAALELAERLRLDATPAGLPAKSRKHILEQRQNTLRTARDLGSKIGCTPE